MLQAAGASTSCGGRWHGAARKVRACRSAGTRQLRAYAQARLTIVAVIPGTAKPSVGVGWLHGGAEFHGPLSEPLDIHVLLFACWSPLWSCVLHAGWAVFWPILHCPDWQALARTSPWVQVLLCILWSGGGLPQQRGVRQLVRCAYCMCVGLCGGGEGVLCPSLLWGSEGGTRASI